MHGLPLRRQSFVCSVILQLSHVLVSHFADQVWSVHLFIWKDRPNTSFENDAVSQAAAMTHFSTSVLGVFLPRSVRNDARSQARGTSARGCQFR
jgi:hypothetical protein